MKEMRVLSPTAILGYGFPMASFGEGMRRKPHVIAVDGGSTDPGPYYLGSGQSFTDRGAVKRDLAIIIEAALEAGIPVIVGSAGGSGGDSHLAWCVDIVKEIGAEVARDFKLASIGAEIHKNVVIEAIRQGKIEPLRPVKPLTEAEAAQSERIVAQMGSEPIIEALEGGADVIIAGRAYDPVSFAALAIKEGFDPGLALHMGKILECAAIASTPGSGSDCMMGYLYEDRFELEPLSPIRQCTTLSVAAHTLYEKTDPYSLPGPGGTLDLRATEFEAVTDRRVAVHGTKFIPSAGYTVKLEGAKKVGYRTVAIAGTRDPRMIHQIDTIIKEVKDRVKDNFKGQVDNYYLDVKVYGKNAVMGDLEPMTAITSHEIGLIIEAVAHTQDIANTICSFARSTMLHYGYDGRVSTAGNLAFPYSPSDFKAGAVYAFNVYHIMTIDDPKALFPITYEQIKGGAR